MESLNNLTAKASTAISAPRGKVWAALVHADAIRSYMFGAEVESTWVEGAPIFWRGVWQGKAYEDKGTILQWQPESRLSYTHFSPLSGLPDAPENYHTVRIELKDDGDQILLLLEQDNNRDEPARAHSEKNWEFMLIGLKKYVEQTA